MSLNRTELHVAFTKWQQARRTLPTEETFLLEIGNLCQQAGHKAIRDLEGRIREEVERLCLHVSGYGFGFLPPNKAVAIFGPKPSPSSQTGWSEVLTFMCALYIATHLRKTLSRRRPKDPVPLLQDPIPLEQATLLDNPGTTRSPLLQRMRRFILCSLSKAGYRRPEIRSEIPKKGSLSKVQLKAGLPTETPLVIGKITPSASQGIAKRAEPSMKKRKFSVDPEEDDTMSAHTLKRSKREKSLPTKETEAPKEGGGSSTSDDGYWSAEGETPLLNTRQALDQADPQKSLQSAGPHPNEPNSHGSSLPHSV